MPKVVGPSGITATAGVPISTTLEYVIINGAKLWLKGTDPAGSAADADVWIDNTP